jgi:hypothetical protein
VGGVGENSATALANTTADFGTLGATAAGSAAEGSAFPVIGAGASAEYNDTIRVLSADPATASVDVTFEIALEGTYSATDGATFGLPNAACAANAHMFGGPDLLLGVSWAGGNLTDLVTLIVPVNVDPPIGAFLGVSGLAWNGSFAANFGSTLHSYIFSDIAGITITSESRHDYGLPGSTGTGTNSVPEPAMCSVLALGLAGLFASRGRRAR